LLGVLIVALRASVNRPLGALGGYIDLAEHFTRPRELGFTAFLLFGILLGGTVFAFTAGTIAWTFVYSAADPLLPDGMAGQSAVLLLAGAVIGAGARTAGGCTSGHGLCGISLGSKASVVATLTFFATAVAATNVASWLIGGQR
jgi:uncharacterized membrane protein YedE/YeeE